MSSPTYAIETSKRQDGALSLRTRILLVLLVWGIETIYLPTSGRVTGGMEPKLPIDIFPIWTIWVLPYVLCYLLWFFAFVWVTFKMEDRLFRAFSAACLLTFSMGIATFIFFPTYIPAASLPGKDIFTALLRFIHENWGRYDAFPSGHVYITTLLALFFNRWYPRWKPVWISSVVIVALSTLFTGQHYILDVIGGFVIALVGYHFGFWWTGFYPAQRRIAKRSRERVISSSD